MQVLNPLKQDTVILENFRKMMTDFSFLKKIVLITVCTALISETNCILNFPT